MPHYVSFGDVPRKRHTFHRDPAGHRFAEELMGEEGFSGASSLLYHRGSPSAITAVEAVDTFAAERAPLTSNDPVIPMHLRAPLLAGGGDAVTGRRVLLGNRSLTIAWAAVDRSSELYRNAAGDELVYVQSGELTHESVFGRLDVSAGDYVVVPASTTQRWVLRSAGAELLVVEANGHLDVPDRYVTERGQLKEGAPFSERDLRLPVGPLVHEGEQIPVIVRTRAGWATHYHRTHPFDVVGWDGCLYPYALSIRDFEPIVGRIHQPPPVHQTFTGPGFVICSFVPRLFDFDPDAVVVPYHHANVDSDEVLFYSDGDFMSRKGSGIGVGSLTLHPAGFVHGPQPGSVEAAIGATRTEETAVMVDTFEPLLVSADARSVTDPDYPWTWAGGSRQI